MEKERGTLPQILSPSSSLRRRTGNDSGSPEFEFWMVRNPSFPQPNLVSADELFVDGILQPLQLLQHRREPDPPPNQEPDPGVSLPDSIVSVSRRWKDIFKKSSDRKIKNHEDKENEKKKEKRVSGLSSAELNINIWPFSRSRSAGNGGSRPRMAAATARKVSSAPCSRSNSAGESKSRKWPSSPSRGGVHLGRSSPVWQVRRGGRGSEPVVRNAINGVKIEANETRRSKAASVGGGGGGAKAKVLNLNVPPCIGYRSHLSCRSDEIENSAVGIVAGGAASKNGRARGSDYRGRGNNNLFNLRGLFTKKVY